ncbi:MAG TPA: PP2C family protein-serine/threonine phosphatase [Actinomycetota bacterium]|nr:PP2C family protein-serine/threonine phosphatase [Actinomycetota bacterium]
MGNGGTTVDRVLATLLDALDRASAADILPTSLEVLREPLRLRALDLYVADYGEELLRKVEPGGGNGQEEIRLPGTLAGRAYLTRQTVSSNGDGGRSLWIPVFRRSENVGVLRVASDATDPESAALAEAASRLIGGAVLAARRHSDVFEVARGARDVSLAAAIQWDLLPLPTYREPQVEVAGRVEPAYDIGGDAFDFAANGSHVDLAVFDAMGHGIGATLLTALAVGAYRHSRRQRSDVAAIARDLDEAVADQVAAERFVTGHVCRLDPDRGTLAWINAGHPLPVLIRNHAAQPLGDATPGLPFGLGGEPAPETVIGLQPDDIVLFYSDGVIEARPNGGPEFGMERFLDLATRHGDPEVDLLVQVRQVLDAVKEHAGRRLRDDATLVAVRWRPDGSPRTAAG